MESVTDWPADMFDFDWAYLSSPLGKNEQGLKVQSIEPEKNRTETRLDWKKPDFQLQFDHSMKKKTEKNQ